MKTITLFILSLSLFVALSSSQYLLEQLYQDEKCATKPVFTLAVKSTTCKPTPCTPSLDVPGVFSSYSCVEEVTVTEGQAVGTYSEDDDCKGQQLIEFLPADVCMPHYRDIFYPYGRYQTDSRPVMYGKTSCTNNIIKTTWYYDPICTTNASYFYSDNVGQCSQGVKYFCS